jgi:hypothetical protein
MTTFLKLLFFIIIVSFVYSNQSHASTDKAQFLTKKEQAEIAEYLNGICPDTFCGGDYNFTNIGLFCNDICTIYYDVSPASREDFFTTEEFFHAPEEYKFENNRDFYLKLYKPRLFQDHYYGVNGELLYFRNIKITARCSLKGVPYGQIMTFSAKKELIYDQQLKCVDQMIDSMRNIHSFLSY